MSKEKMTKAELVELCKRQEEKLEIYKVLQKYAKVSGMFESMIDSVQVVNEYEHGLVILSKDECISTFALLTIREIQEMVCMLREIQEILSKNEMEFMKRKIKLEEEGKITLGYSYLCEID